MDQRGVPHKIAKNYNVLLSFWMSVEAAGTMINLSSVGLLYQKLPFLTTGCFLFYDAVQYVNQK